MSIPTAKTLPPVRLADVWLIVLALGIALVTTVFGEKMLHDGGFGYDGVNYGKWAADPSIFLHGPISQFHLQRVLPSLVVHAGLRLAGAPLTGPNIILGFGLMNVALAGVCAGIWCATANVLKISLRGKWLGFVGLFASYALLKHPAYSPVLTDIPGLTVGMGMVYCYLRGARWWLLVWIVIGSFTWPTALVQGMALFLFPRERDQAEESGPAPFRLNLWIAGAATLLLLALYAGRLRYGTQALTDLGPWHIPVSILVCLGFLFSGLMPLLDDRRLFDVRRIFRRVFSLPALALLAVLGGVFAVQKGLATVPNERVGLVWAIVGLTKWSIASPAIFLVAHAVFFGPIVVLAVLLWKRIAALMNQHGPGLVICGGLLVLMSLNSESRWLFGLFPVLLPFVVLAAEELNWTSTHTAAFTVLSLLCSKFWLVIGGRPYSGRGEQYIPENQLYFMNHGPWMFTQWYLIQGACLVLVFLFLGFGFVRGRSDGHRTSEGVT